MPDGRVLLVRAAGTGWTYPGGRLESGETAPAALGREVAEEGCALVLAARYLGCLRVEPGGGVEAVFAARVLLRDWVPRHGTVARKVVPVDRVVAEVAADQALRPVVAEVLVVAVRWWGGQLVGRPR